MSALFVLIGFSLLIALFFLGAFIWASRSGQFDDKTTPALRILFDNTTARKNSNSRDARAE